MYHITIFDAAGKKIVDQPLTADDDQQAIVLGQAKIEELSTGGPFAHRIVTPAGRLLSFDPHTYHPR